MAGPVTVLRALIDAAFRSGSISDAKREELHGVLDAAEAPEPAEAESEAPPAPAPEAVPEVSTEAGGFVG